MENEELIPKDSREEIEIRTSSVYACELLREELAKLGKKFTNPEIDWILWNQAKQIETGLPYHKTLTIYY